MKMNRNKNMKRTEENMIHKRQKNIYNLHRIRTPKKTKTNTKIIFYFSIIYLFTFGCVGSLLLCVGFL